MLKSGTIIDADCDAHQVRGPLIGDHDCLDGLVRLHDEYEDKETVLNGWLWSIDVVEDSAE